MNLPPDAPPVIVAFFAGLISFLSPCVLPLIPSYLGVLGGAAPLPRALGFITGFGIIFIALGAAASTLGALLIVHKVLLGKLAAVLIIFFGSVMLGLIRLPILMRDTRLLYGTKYSSVALGAAFAFGWSPCLGPTLGSILGLAASSTNLSKGILLLFAYTVGLAMPLLFTAVLWHRIRLQSLNQYALYFEKAGGLVLIIVGCLMLSGQLTRLATYFYGIKAWLQ